MHKQTLEVLKLLKKEVYCTFNNLKRERVKIVTAIS